MLNKWLLNSAPPPNLCSHSAFLLKLMISPFLLLVGLEILESCLPVSSVPSVAEVYRINLQNTSPVLLFSLPPLFQASILFLLQPLVGLSKLKFFFLHSVHNASFLFPKSRCHRTWKQVKLVTSFSRWRCHPSRPLRRRAHRLVSVWSTRRALPPLSRILRIVASGSISHAPSSMKPFQFLSVSCALVLRHSPALWIPAMALIICLTGTYWMSFWVGVGLGDMQGQEGEWIQIE